MTALQVTGCSHRFGPVQALDAVSLEVRKGELFGLIGPDGAGKSTLIRSALGIHQADSGTFSFFGEDRKVNPSVVKDRVGYLSQQFSLYEDMTVSENIRFFAEIHGVEGYESRQRELLAFTRMEAFGDRLAGQLSGGMKQKLALACTLIHQPDLIILDEPTTGVDPLSRRDFWRILTDLIRQGLAILVATPYMDEAERCHRVGLINAGHILTVASPGELRDSLGKKVLELIPDEPRKVLAETGVLFPGIPAHLLGERIQLLIPSGQNPQDLINQLSRQSVTIRHWRELDPTMETIFIHQISGQS